MSTYKRLNRQDAYITTYTAHKTWAVSGSDLALYGIQVYTATGSYSASLKQLYYPSKSAGNVVSHSHDYYNQTTLHFPQSRQLQGNSRVVSIPKNLYGVTIPADGSFKLLVDNTLYVAEDYWAEDYTEGLVNGVGIVDDGEGNLYLSASNPREYVGDIVYPHGVAVITHPTWSQQEIYNITFNSSQPIYTHNYHCKLRESEVNYTYNPTALSSSLKTTYDNEGNVYSTSSSIADGAINSNITGSSFQPYITTVGLYNDTNQLIAVGKLSRPVPKSGNTEMTLIVKIDI